MTGNPKATWMRNALAIKDNDIWSSRAEQRPAARLELHGRITSRECRESRWCSPGPYTRRQPGS